MRVVSVAAALLLPLSLTVAVAGQDAAGGQAPKPAPQLKQYEPMLGNWEGAGEVVPGPGAKAVAWTGQATTQWTLGGFFGEERMRIALGQGTPDVTMHNFYGFDPETQRFMLYGANSNGEVERARLSWSDAATLVGVGTGSHGGQPYAERWTVRYGKDSMELRVDRAVGDAPFFVHVTARFTRSKTAPAAFSDGGGGQTLTQAELKPIGAMLGTWKFKGAMIPAPGAPEMAVTGTETVTAALGGTVIRSHVQGDAGAGMPGYEGFSYCAWDRNDRCYDAFCLDSMGMVAWMEGRLLPDGALVWTESQPQMGQPGAGRVVQTLGPDVMKITCDRLRGVAPVVREFHGEYTRQK